MKTLLLVLVAVVVVASVAFYFYHKMDLVHRGHQLDWSDGDSVIVSEDELQEFMFEIEADLESEPLKNRSEVNVGSYHAIA